MKKNTDELEALLKETAPEQFLRQHREELYLQEKPFAAYMRAVLASHGVKQHNLFIRVGFAQKVGYQILSEEKRTKQRDYILRLCIAGHLTLEETQHALRLYHMAPLYVRLPRDAVLLSAFHKGLTSIEEVDTLLRAQGMSPLRSPAKKSTFPPKTSSPSDE